MSNLKRFSLFALATVTEFLVLLGCRAVMFSDSVLAPLGALVAAVSVFGWLYWLKSIHNNKG